MNSVKRSVGLISNRIAAKPLYYVVPFVVGRNILLDIGVQHYIEQRDAKIKKLDIGRIAFFGVFGIFVSVSVHGLYSRLIPHLLDVRHAQYFNSRPILKWSCATFCDIGLYSPFMYFPVYYGLQSQFYNDIGWESCQKRIEFYFRERFIIDNKLWMTIIVPAHLMTFTVVPIHGRIFWTQAVATIWTFVLSKYNNPRDKNVRKIAHY